MHDSGNNDDGEYCHRLIIMRAMMLVLATVIVFRHSIDAQGHLSSPHCTNVHQPINRGARKGLGPSD